MTHPPAYETDLAYIHDQGYGGFARGAAPGLLQHFRQAGIGDGLIVDLGCGSGIWARQLVNAGYAVVGVDISPAMIAIARQRVPEAEFRAESFLRFCIPPCRAITALGEVFNYLFDADHSQESLERVCRNAFDTLPPGGLLIFDVAGPERFRERTQSFTEGDDWACLVAYQHDAAQQQLTRRIVTFRQVGEQYRRQVEVHRQQLFEPDTVATLLERIGFRVEIVTSYGEYRLGEGVTGFIAQRPAA